NHKSYFNFVSRLMEQEGIYYYFKHEDGKHTMVLINASSLHEPAAGFETMEYIPRDKGSIDQDSIYYWIEMGQFESGVFKYADYSLETPKNIMRGEHEVARPYAKANLERFDYPGRYAAAGDATNHAKYRAEELK